MSIIVDTNVLLRFMVDDDPLQGSIARALFTETDVIIIPATALCESVWVLSQSYNLPLREIAAAIRQLIVADNVRIDRPAVDAGLAHLDTGGDFADGVIAHEGRCLGGTSFVSFDRGAIRRLNDLGVTARIPS